MELISRCLDNSEVGRNKHNFCRWKSYLQNLLEFFEAVSDNVNMDK